MSPIVGVIAQPHEEFANLADGEQALEQFTRRWGVVSESPMFEGMKLGWRDMLRKGWQGDEGALKEIQGWMNTYMITSLKFRDGGIEMEPKDLLGTIFLFFLRDHLASRTAICGNPECAQPFFIKRRATQRFCGSVSCSAYAQGQYAMKWWNEDGKKQREERRKKAQAKARGRKN